MALTVSETGGGDFKQPPVGTTVARCIRLIDLGLQRGEWQGKPLTRKQILVTWELPNELMEDGRPFVVSKFYTASLSEKANLRKDLVSWRGREFTDAELANFDLKKVLGAPCMLSLVAKDNGKVKVGAIMALPKGTNVPPSANEAFAFDIDTFSHELYNQLSPGIRNIIDTRVVEDELVPEGGHDGVEPFAGAGTAGLSDDIPF